MWPPAAQENGSRMNYRHAYHAGNFADVVKHVLMSRLIEYLKRKDKPFRVFDTHAGRGLYALSANEAVRTGEHAEGIGRLRAAAELTTNPLFEPYFTALQPDLEQERYPGSPLIARRLLRPKDRLSAYELHPEEATVLKAVFVGDIQTKAIELDGWLALGSHVPPKEKRGLVLIDPPFEKPSEVEDIVLALGKALRRWPGGIYALWYPLKHRETVEALHDGLRALGIADMVVADFFRAPYSADQRFVGTGMAVINPPFVFAEEAEAIMKALLPVLGRDPGATYEVFAPPPAKP
ncbi:23S rRNA (adenine(2030)-N(6))-methyltransferase RlmJ [Aurantimonas sp. C2-5-R2]|uniref:23S rRNA (adenine(2030)-N(6))-methyltransferase RlmJ n=1 Tax=unclassified Aurantimonas TaxID=2638230 RepID=UPI002E195D56|nr:MULTISPECIES: 23S rRNA (adenine(2030)-N(6))-methyltransferase RlmJ [unclassified Aurantimonas]MEC5290632.1 23S rRNA (adenine(2030)-N(6))-methyltransferase RlmJ [Aurantimonas sp. C2-3-R2]MEC5411700.1 23S rRNA (adenine(2030)-N(6))-methyltransferase RlmJ [Aurantimonas sp. C2-4-R8]